MKVFVIIDNNNVHADNNIVDICETRALATDIINNQIDPEDFDIVEKELVQK